MAAGTFWFAKKLSVVSRLFTLQKKVFSKNKQINWKT